MRSTRRNRTTIALAGLLAVALSTGCGSSGDGKADASSGGDAGGTALPAAKLSLVAYSTPQEAYGKIIKAFRATPQGRNITFTESYGSSGDQSRAVEAGLA